MNRSYVLVSDLDGTLIGDEEALHRFVEWSAHHRRRLRLVYATGRHFVSVEKLLSNTELPEPDAVICSVGTETYLFPSRRRLRSAVYRPPSQRVPHAKQKRTISRSP